MKGMNIVVLVTLTTQQQEFGNNWHISAATPSAIIIYSLLKADVLLKRAHVRSPKAFFKLSAR
jgi:hypothetical protein